MPFIELTKAESPTTVLVASDRIEYMRRTVAEEIGSQVPECTVVCLSNYAIFVTESLPVILAKIAEAKE